MVTSNSNNIVVRKDVKEFTCTMNSVNPDFMTIMKNITSYNNILDISKF